MRDQGKGKANDISGIPLPNAIPQVQGQSVEPNRDEPQGAFDIDGTGEMYAHDYFDDAEDELGGLDKPYIANKDDENWSDGLQDEENEPDDLDDEGLFPESQPLHTDLASVPEIGEEDNLDVVLRPNNIQGDSA